MGCLKSVRTILRGLVDYGFRGAKMSYSQYGEDVIVQFALNNMGIQRPRYIDIGANKPYTGSNTALFYESGSSGINIEPDPFLFEAFLRFRKRDINLNLGVLDQSDERDFYVMSYRDMSTFLKHEAEDRIRKFGAEILHVIKVKVSSLNEIFGEYAGQNPPQFMSIDAEGADEMILRAFDFGSWSPEVICCETLAFVSPTKWEKNESLVRFIETRGYFVLADTWLNTIFVLERAWRNAMPESLSFTRKPRNLAPRSGSHGLSRTTQPSFPRQPKQDRNGDANND